MSFSVQTQLLISLTFNRCRQAQNISLGIYQSLTDSFFTFSMKLEDVFHDYDPRRKGHVSKDDFRKACKEIFQELLTEEQLDGIQSHYCSDDRPDQCNWSSFMHDAESGLYHARFSPCSSLNIFYYRYPKLEI